MAGTPRPIFHFSLGSVHVPFKLFHASGISAGASCLSNQGVQWVPQGPWQWLVTKGNHQANTSRLFSLLPLIATSLARRSGPRSRFQPGHFHQSAVHSFLEHKLFLCQVSASEMQMFKSPLDALKIYWVYLHSGLQHTRDGKGGSPFLLTIPHEMQSP